MAPWVASVDFYLNDPENYPFSFIFHPQAENVWIGP